MSSDLCNKNNSSRIKVRAVSATECDNATGVILSTECDNATGVILSTECDNATGVILSTEIRF